VIFFWQVLNLNNIVALRERLDCGLATLVINERERIDVEGLERAVRDLDVLGVVNI
jgi:hypothetical protein